MVLQYSVEYFPENGTIEASEQFRYFLILEGRGKCESNHKHFSLELHDVLAVPLNTKLNIIADCPILTGCIRVLDMKTPRPDVYHLPGEHTGLMRQLFYMAMDIKHTDLPFFDTVRSSLDQLVYSALIAAELAADSLNPTVVQVVQQINENFTDRV